MAIAWRAFTVGWISVPTINRPARNQALSQVLSQANAAIRAKLRQSWLKPVVFIAALSPALWMAYKAFDGNLGANPIQALYRGFGDDAITFLMIALAVTPLRRLTGWAEVVRLRRMLGLFAFFYAILHFLSYAGLDQQFDWAAIGKDILKRRYITVGMAVITILTALAITSPRAVVRWMGGKRWRNLHRLVYVAGAGAVFHYYMMVKADTRPPLEYGAVLVVLLLLRLPMPRRSAPKMQQQRDPS